MELCSFWVLVIYLWWQSTALAGSLSTSMARVWSSPVFDSFDYYQEPDHWFCSRTRPNSNWTSGPVLNDSVPVQTGSNQRTMVVWVVGCKIPETPQSCSKSRLFPIFPIQTSVYCQYNIPILHRRLCTTVWVCSCWYLCQHLSSSSGRRTLVQYQCP